MPRLLRSPLLFGGFLLAFSLSFLFVLTSTATTAEAAAGVAQGAVVPESPRRDLPVVTNGRVLAHAQVGNRIFVGGDFTQVRETNGTTINQAYLFAYDINTGQVDPNFRPEINNVVRALEPRIDGDGLYVGGNFTRWDDSFPLRIARLNAQGDLFTGFLARASARVESIVDVGNSVYLGGDFLDVSGHSVTGLAKVARNSGAVDTRFSPQFTNLVNGSNIVRTIGATPDGSSLFALHYARQVDGQTREAVVKFNLNNNTASLSGWNIPWTAQTNQQDCQEALRDMAISPNGAFLVIAGQGGDNPPNCDSVLRYPTAGNGTVNFQWAARMYSSVFSLAVSDVAVYVGGHFCAAPRNGAPAGGVTSTFDGQAGECVVNNPNSPLNPSQIDPNGAVFRNQIAALNPNSGQALAWDPGSNNSVGVFDLTLIDRGLLAGHDNDRFNALNVGRSGFFDFQANTNDTQAPSATVTNPRNNAVVSSVGQLTGAASDNRTVVDVTVRLRNRDTGLYLNNAGNFVVSNVALTAPLTPTGLSQFTWTANVNRNTLPEGRYQVTAFSRDEFGNTSPVATSNFTISPGGGDGTCSTSLNGAGNPVVTWTAIAGVSSYVVRDGGGWVSTVENGTSFTDTSPANGSTTYTLRVRPRGVLTDIPCGTVTVGGGGGGGGGGGTVCSTSLNGAGNPVVTWTAIAGVSSYVVRDGGGWVSTVENGTSFTDTSPANGSTTYTLRVRPRGVLTDIPCGTVTVGGGGGGGGALTCSASLNAAGNPLITWTQVNGVGEYQVRDNDGWVATQTDDRYVDTNPTNGSRTYEIRYRIAGQVFDTTCTPTVNVN